VSSAFEAEIEGAERTLSAMSGTSLRRLHRGVIDQRSDVRALLERARVERCELSNGVDRRSAARSARISWVAQDHLRLRAPNIRASGQPQIYLHFDLGSCRYFFASPPLAGGGDEPLDVELPSAIYEAERRDLPRVPVADEADPPRVRLERKGGGAPIDAQVRDWSYQGLGLSLAECDRLALGEALVVDFVDGERAGERRFGTVMHRRRDPDRPHRSLVGLEVSEVAQAPPFPVERRDQILEGGRGRRAWRRVSLAGAMVRSLPHRRMRKEAEVEQDRREIELASYQNEAGEEICGLLDRTGSGAGGTAVVIPPAWGRTKETFLALARTIVANFQAIGEPVSVLRFDGTNRRGESYIDPECRGPGDENLHFRFSRAVLDIEASFDFLESRKDIAPDNFVLVTFSLGAIEGRRAMVRDAGRRVAGWISVVGMVDVQSGLRTVSGGLDFIYGLSQGVEFGRHELVGAVADIDRAGRDAIENRLVFLEDAKRDMAAIERPVTWIHGRHDAWMELDRVQALLAAGRRDNRRLFEVPAGHQMRSSREALETFQLVSGEIIRIAAGRQVEPVLPDLDALDLRTRAERSRRPPPELDAPAFWEDYLLGRDRRLGFEIMSATTAYRDLMSLQIERLGIAAGHRIVDLGAGNGELAIQLAERAVPDGVRITQLDLVPSALVRGRERLARLRAPFEVDRLAADLELASRSIPLAPARADSILASLLLSYVKHPHELLCAMRELLKPGGRLVVSSMKRDADISRIYVDAITELPPDRRRAHFGVDPDEFDELQRVFLNDAARLLHLEESGRFHFWQAEELAAMCAEAGLEVEATDVAFGSPPQAVVVTARRPVSEG
jgi:ubiquinone/menaquinone biosynthesis C-methylase UbiE